MPTPTPQAARGMVVAPHHLAAQAGLGVLRDGGNAVEAAVATAAAIAVLYPHMNSLGGDNFWLISDGPGSGAPRAIDACGPAAAAASIDFYAEQGLASIPERGPLAALTVAGAIGGWQAALAAAAEWGGTLPLARLLEDATTYARDGFPVTVSQHANTAAKLAELRAVPGFAGHFLRAGAVPAVGDIFTQAPLGATLERLAAAGLDDYYRGDLGAEIAAALAAAGSPLARADLEAYQALAVEPLAVSLSSGTAYSLPPPTQGLASLMILGLFERLGITEPESFEHIHGLIECTKEAFRVRDAYVSDPAYMTVDPAEFLKKDYLDQTAVAVDLGRAAPFGGPASGGDTVWFGAIDSAGRAVSAIQSIYWEFGSGVVLDDLGITWQNRGTSFSLDDAAVNPLTPGRRPFHTIHPALAQLADGRLMVYGTMGGDGQPQTQAALFTRYITYGQGLRDAIAAPRWLLGRTWGSPVSNLRIESRLDAELIEQLRQIGQDVEVVEPITEVMGHAGAIVRHPSGRIEGAADPRGDGSAAGY